jgi:PAS domain S-box-containing protein
MKQTKQKVKSKEKPDTLAVLRRKARALRQSVAKYQSLFESMINGFAFHKVLFDDSGKPRDYVFLEVNNAFERLTGLRREDVIGKKVTDILRGIENDPADWIDTYVRVALTGQATQFEHYSVALKKWYSVSSYSPEKGYLASIFEDITERKRAEEALRKSEERLKRSQEIAHLGSWELDLVNNHLSWSDEVYQIFGLQPREFGATYKAFLEAVHPNDRAAVDAAYSGSLREGRDSYEIEHRVVRKSSGEVRIVHEKCEHIRDESGRIIRSIGMVHDITERKMLEEALDKYTEHLKTLVKERTEELSKAYMEFEAFFNYSITPLVFLDRDFNFIRVNEAYAIACQRVISDFPGHNHFEFYPDKENEAIFRKVIETKIPYQAVAKPFSFPDHPELVSYWDWTLTPILDKHGEVDFLVFSLNDVTKKKHAEEELINERQRFYDVLEMLPAYLVLLTPDYHVDFANRFFRERFGESFGRRCFEYLFGRTEPCEICETYKVLKTGLPQRWEWTGPDGRHYDVYDYPFTDIDGSPLIMEMGIDITERKQAEKALKVYSNQRAVIAELGQTALAGMDLYVLMNKAVALVAQALGVEYCKVLELLPDGKALLLKAGVGWKDGLIGKATVRSGKESQAGFTLLSEEPVIVEDLRTETRFSSPHLLYDHGVVSGISVIIPGRERTYGVLGAHTTKQRAFTPDDIHFLQAVANVLAEAIEKKLASEELEQSEKKYRTLIEQAADGIAILDKWLNIVDVNPAICQMSGFSREELSGLNFKTLIPSEDLSTRPLQIEQLFGGETVREERKVFRKDGVLIDVEATFRLLKGGNIQVIARDITERKERESSDRLIASLLELFAKKESRKEYLDAVVQLIHEWCNCQCVGIRVVNDYGYIPYESYAGFSLEFIKIENMLSLNNDICACVRTVTGQFEQQDKSVLTPNGSFCINNSLEFADRLTQEELARFRGNCIRSGFLSITLVPVRYRGRTIGLIHLADKREGALHRKVIDVLETINSVIGEAIFKFNTEEALRTSQEQLRELFAHLHSVREQERTQIAREIHDEFGAVLTGLKVDLSSLEKKMPAERELVQERLREDLNLIDSAIKIIQKISSELRPSALDHLGLTAAIEWQVKEFGNRSGIPWEISIDVKDTKLDKDLSTSVFRIFQEALINIIRHAEATKIHVNLKEMDGFLILDVIDNGKGIPEEKLSDPHSFGLMGIRERVQYLGGDFEIKGIMNKGTTVTVKIPVKGKEAV